MDNTLYHMFLKATIMRDDIQNILYGYSYMSVFQIFIYTAVQQV